MIKKRILVAMSGGVDSSVAAAMLLEQGYQVEGATMLLFGQDGKGPAEGCGASLAIANAKEVADKLGIRHHVFDFTELFRERVMNPFIAAYQAGRTPNPCVMCNDALKFGAFLQKAVQMGFDGIATGHYGRVVYEEGEWRLFLSHSAGKDQSYVLYQLTQEQLSRLMLPLEGMEKQKVRQKARELGLSVSEAKDSQEICFIPDDNYARFLLESGCTASPGDFTDTSGRVIGRHKGLLYYTVGQRKGLGQAFGTPKYVVALDEQNNRVVLGENSETFRQTFTASRVHFIDGKWPQNPVAAQVKIRYSAPAARAMLLPAEPGRVQVVFDTPQRAVTPGQSAVFYDGDRVLGGGIID